MQKQKSLGSIFFDLKLIRTYCCVLAFIFCGVLGSLSFKAEAAPTSSSAELIDKILAIFNNEIITLSEVDHIKEHFNARRMISPQLYDLENADRKDLVELHIRGLLIRAKLETLGYIISDAQVEEQIKETEKRNRIGREELLSFLASNNLTMDEYFYIIKSTIEFNLFHSLVITPLVSITESQIKNKYIELYQEKEVLSLSYDLELYAFPKKSLNAQDLSSLLSHLNDYKSKNISHPMLKDMIVTPLGKVSDAGLTPQVRSTLQKTDIKNFSAPIPNNLEYHVFYVEDKKITDSNKYLESKENIRNIIFMEKAKQILKTWVEREKSNYFIKTFWD